MTKRPSPKDADMPKLPLELAAAGDRGCAIVSAALLESLLEHLLRRSMLSQCSEPLFATYGPLTSFAAKIDLAAALALLTPAEAADLHLIRKIRNEFAHEISQLESQRSQSPVCFSASAFGGRR